MAKHEPRTSQPAELGAIEFEITDFNSARRSLNEPPPGIEERKHLESGYWEARRRRVVPSDRALTGLTIDWVLSLPEPVRPMHLCEAFPRVANTVAEIWPDRGVVTSMVGSLLADDRGGSRRGFPTEVQADLTLLHRYLQGLQQSA
jgi:hypothetical protein